MCRPLRPIGHIVSKGYIAPKGYITSQRDISWRAIALFFQVAPCPAFLYRQITATYAERSVWHVFVYRSATRNKTPLSNSQRRNKVGVATNETTSADLRFVFGLAVVVDEYHAATDIGVSANSSIADITKMTCLNTALERAVFDFYEVAHATAVAYLRVVSEMRVGTNDTV